MLNILNISFVICYFIPRMQCYDLSLMSSSSDIVFSLVHYIGETFHETLYLTCGVFPFQYFSLIFLYYFYFFAEFHFNILFWLSYFIGFLVFFMFSRDSFMSLFSSLNILIIILLQSLGFYRLHSHWSCYYGIRNFWRSCGPLDFNIYYITMLSFIHLFLSLCLSFLSAVFFQLKYFQCSSRSRLW